jgi:hypothetical protein
MTAKKMAPVTMSLIRDFLYAHASITYLSLVETRADQIRVVSCARGILSPRNSHRYTCRVTQRVARALHRDRVRSSPRAARHPYRQRARNDKHSPFWSLHPFFETK